MSTGKQSRMDLEDYNVMLFNEAGIKEGMCKIFNKTKK
jgi:hypothetical protein